MYRLTFKQFCTFVFCFGLVGLSANNSFAQAPVPFNANYEVKFLKGFKADAELSLELLENDEYKIDSFAELKFLGRRMTTVSVDGEFLWQDDKVMPQNYEYIQTGLGKRKRTIEYDWLNQQANTVVKGKEKVLEIEEDSMLDELNMYIEIQQQAARGVEDIHLNVIDEDEIKQYHYRYVGEEELETDLGTFNTVKYLRVRGEGSSRVTELWMAKDWDYLVIHLSQKTKVRTFQINLRNATVNNVAMTPLDKAG